MSAETIPLIPPDTEDTGVFLRRWSRKEFDQAIQLGWFDVKSVVLLDGTVYDRSSGQPYRMTREKYYEAAELGWYDGQRVELIYGKVYLKMPMGIAHKKGLRATEDALRITFGEGFDVGAQFPLVLSTDGEPQPDVLVIPGSWEDYDRHPTQADTLLLVEVSDSTLYYDQNGKAMLYAEAGIADYWLLNLQNRTLEVRREPEQTADGFGYRSVTIYSETESVAPLAAPHAPVRVEDLLPPQAKNENSGDV